MERSESIFYWLPRCLSIIAIIIVSAFSFDVFQSGDSFAGKWEDLVIHLVPSYLLTVILVVAWKWEYTGGIIFLVIGGGIGAYFVATNGIVIAMILGFAIFSIYFYSTKIIDVPLLFHFTWIEFSLFLLLSFQPFSMIILSCHCLYSYFKEH